MQVKSTVGEMPHFLLFLEAPKVNPRLEHGSFEFLGPAVWPRRSQLHQLQISKWDRIMTHLVKQLLKKPWKAATFWAVLSGASDNVTTDHSAVIYLVIVPDGRFNY